MFAQSCATYLKWAHTAESLRVVPPPRTEKGVTENQSVVENDDEILVAPSQNAMATTRGTHQTVRSPKRAPALCAGERASALCAGERGVCEDATPGARFAAVPPKTDTQGVSVNATPGARECVGASALRTGRGIAAAAMH